MKKILILILTVTLTATASGQQYKKVLVDNSSEYFVKNEKDIYKSRYSQIVESDGNSRIIETFDTVNADLVVDYYPKKANDKEEIVLYSASAKLTGDTLEVLIYNHGFEFIWEYKILIVRDRYLAETWFVPPTTSKQIKIDPVLTSLKLNNLSFKKGTVLKGHSKMEGKCMERVCFSNNIIIEGDFKVTVK